MSEVSVIMGVCNGGPLLRTAVLSILGQFDVDLQLLVMDDGSNDGSSEVLAELSSADPRLTVVSQPNRGLGASLNTLYAQTTSPLVARMDADDVSLPWRLREQVAYLRRRPEVGVVGCWTMMAVDDWLRSGCSCYPDDDSWIKERLRGGLNVLVHSSVMMRRSVLEALRVPYRFRLLQDYDLWLRLAEITSFGMVQRVCHVSRLHAQRISSKQLAVRRGLHAAIRELARERAETGSEVDSVQNIEAEIIRRQSASREVGIDVAWNRAILALYRRELPDARRYLLEVCLSNRGLAGKAARWLVLALMPGGGRLLELANPLYRFWKPIEAVESMPEVEAMAAYLDSADVLTMKYPGRAGSHS